MTRLVVVADDLTGALDACAPFAARGLITRVALGKEGLSEALASGADVVGVSTDSREIAPDAARQAVAAVMSKLPAGVQVFKKVDSRLKGNIAAELDAIPFSRALAVPAIPGFGRWVRNGLLGGFGVSQPIDVAAALGHHAAAATVPDIAHQTDIDQALSSIPHDLTIGARGLAEAVAKRLAPTALPPSEQPIIALAICVIGSTDPITTEQILRLRQACGQLSYIAAPDGILTDGLPEQGDLTVLQATKGQGAAPATVARRLAEIVLRLDPRQGAALFVSGGATAQVVLRSLGIEVLDLAGEAQPGLPIARGGGFTIITKSGGFGEPDTLLHLLGHLGGAHSEKRG